METLWFAIFSLMLTAYVIFDGFDLGAGVVHLYAARTDEERRRVLASIGPVWDGNEVWLLASGGVLFFAFPDVYASSFSGFYLPLMIVLWLLMLRGLAVEFRSKIGNAVWPPFWDVVFAGSSGLLAVLFGAALGNVVRGVPLDEEGMFFLPLWTNFLPGPDPGVLDWYTVTVGIAAFVALTAHGALWVALRTGGDLNARCHSLFRRAWWALAASTAAVTIASFQVQPQLQTRLLSQPAGFGLPIVALAGLVAMKAFDQRRAEVRAFLASCVYIAGMLTSAMFSLYPYLLPPNQPGLDGLTVFNSAASPTGLTIGIWWFTPGIILVAAYFTFSYSRLREKLG